MFLKLTTFYPLEDQSPQTEPLLLDVDSIEAVRNARVETMTATKPTPYSNFETKVLITTKSGDTYAVMEPFDEVEKRLKQVLGGTGMTVFA